MPVNTGSSLSLDLAAPTTPFPHFWERAVGTGYAALVLRRDYQDHLRYVHEHCGFKYARFHGIFHDNLGVVRRGHTCRRDPASRRLLREVAGDPQAPLTFNWLYVDKVYDALLEIGVKPFIELGFMPECLASAPHRHFWWEGNVSPPADWADWAHLVRSFAAHLVDRYGLDEVATWPFEVWNEPNLPQFWSGTTEEYFELYRHAALAVKSVDPCLRIGGPASCGEDGLEFLRRFLRYVRATGTPCDFVTAHCYGTGEDFADGVVHRRLRITDRVQKAVATATRILAEENCAHLPLEYTEWGPQTGLFDIIHDHEFTPAYIAHTLAGVVGQLASFAYWTHSDVFEEQGVIRKPFTQGFGLVSFHGIPKPACHAFALLHRLGTERLPVTGDLAAQCLATRHADGSLRLLLWRAEPFKEFELSDRFLYDADDLAEIAVHVTGLGPAASATATLIDRDHANAYTRWLALGSPLELRPAHLATLREASRLVTEPVPLATSTRPGAAATLKLTLRPCSVVLVEIRPAAPA